MSKDSISHFVEQIARGREFEYWERSQWKGERNERIGKEVGIEWRGKHGRIDLRLVDTVEGYTVVVETKATDWDAMRPYRVRSNVLRHARQIWRYIEATLKDQPVLPAVIYPKSPAEPGRKEEIEGILNDQWIQVVWRDERT